MFIDIVLKVLRSIVDYRADLQIPQNVLVRCFIRSKDIKMAMLMPGTYVFCRFSRAVSASPQAIANPQAKSTSSYWSCVDSVLSRWSDT